jgi:hypothetical protein
MTKHKTQCAQHEGYICVLRCSALQDAKTSAELVFEKILSLPISNNLFSKM